LSLESLRERVDELTAALLDGKIAEEEYRRRLRELREAAITELDEKLVLCEITEEEYRRLRREVDELIPPGGEVAQPTAEAEVRPVDVGPIVDSLSEVREKRGKLRELFDRGEIGERVYSKIDGELAQRESELLERLRELREAAERRLREIGERLEELREREEEAKARWYIGEMSEEEYRSVSSEVRREVGELEREREELERALSLISRGSSGPGGAGTSSGPT